MDIQYKIIVTLWGFSSFSSSLFEFCESVLELCLQRGDLTDEVSDGIREGLLWTVVRSRLDTQDKLVFQRVGHFVTSKKNLLVMKQLAAIQFNPVNWHYSGQSQNTSHIMAS